MNPVLLKPEGDSRSQVIVLGRPWGALGARSFHRRKEELWPIVTGALDRLRATHELVVIEGAGSPAELNLRAADIVNMAVAQHARAPVLLVGDIDRGGIFAQMLGTLWLLEDEERALVRGLVVNKFRGDGSLFADGVRILEERGGVPVLGVVPFLPALAIPEEDAVALDTAGSRALTDAIDVVVIRLPHIANFDDFDPLRAEPGVSVRYVSSVQALARPDAVILPGTKSTIADLLWLHSQGLAKALVQLAGQGVAVAGICGGYQMLGCVIHDPERLESSRMKAQGLGLLPVETRFSNRKATYQAQAHVLPDGPGWLGGMAGQQVEGYEIHLGQTHGGRPWLEISERNGHGVSVADGAVSEDARVWGCYLHGLFANQELRRAWLGSLSDDARTQAARTSGLLCPTLHQALDELADAVVAALDMRRLEAIVREEL
jgi:adenosylcobyric acid synthase